MINSFVAAVLPIPSGDSNSDPVTVVAIIGLAVILIVNLILDARDDAGSRPDAAKPTPCTDEATLPDRTGQRHSTEQESRSPH